MKIIMRGDICNVDLGKPYGSEQGGVRPCLIIQNDIGNEYSPTTIILPITHQSKDFKLTHVEINCLEKKPSFILCEQIRVVDQSRLGKKVGKLNNSDFEEVENKLKLQLGM